MKITITLTEKQARALHEFTMPHWHMPQHVAMKHYDITRTDSDAINDATIKLQEGLLAISIAKRNGVS